MSARSDAFTVSGADVDQGFPQFGVALSFAVTCASRAAVDGSFYVRDLSGLLLGRTDRAHGSIAVWRFDPRPGAVRDRQLAAANARLEEAGPSGSGVQRTEVGMASSAKKKTTSRGAGSSRKKSTTARRPAARKTASAAKASSSPASATATAPREPREKKPTAAQAMAISLLKKHDGAEMKVSELSAAVVSSGKVKLSGKTPAATVGAQIYTAAKAGRWFRKTKRGHVALVAGASS